MLFYLCKVINYLIPSAAEIIKGTVQVLIHCQVKLLLITLAGDMKMLIYMNLCKFWSIQHYVECNCGVL